MDHDHREERAELRTIYLIGRAFLIGYHLALLGLIFFLTVGWKGYYEETLVAAILFLLLYFLIRMASSSHLVVLGWHSLQTLLRLIGRSLSGLLTVAPLLLGIVILSIISHNMFDSGKYFLGEVWTDCAGIGCAAHVFILCQG